MSSVSSASSMVNRSLTISVLIDPPAAMPCALAAYCPQRGIVFEITQIMCERLHFDCTFVPANTTLYGYSENGTWKGVVGDVAAGRVDTSLARFTPTTQRAEVVDFTSSYFYEQILLATRYPSDMSRHSHLNLLHAFGIAVWICIAVVIFIAGLLMSNTILYKRSASVIEKYVIKKLHADLLFTGKHGCIWAISAAALILTKAYTGYLFTTRIALDVEKPFVDLTTFADCIRDGKCSLVLKTGTLSYLYQLLDTNKSEVFGKLRTALEANPLRTLPVDELADHIRNQTSIYETAFIWDTDFYYAANGRHPCDFYVISAGLLPGPNTFPLPKNWTHDKRELDKFATRFNEYGFINELMNKYNIEQLGECQKRLELNEFDSLYFLYDIFVFLGACESLAILCFFVERSKKRIIRLPMPLMLPFTPFSIPLPFNIRIVDD